LYYSYDRTPPCSLAPVTQCSQFFHEVEIDGLQPGTQYYYQIEAANGTTVSDVQKFTTARAAGDTQEFTAVILADMGYANAGGTHQQIQKVCLPSQADFS
jgi:phosphodiesterase/alkaline phosphatase D-like protein